MLLKNNLSII